ncbi:hypothetical protein BN2476_650044 [Paraburkholderia piptadeniae]|uniref:Uncharacterized protein n=1 Tax=Paraburkholderia piptadeniae TaxID=1701573 RepID=A0A1N7SMV3_9BURK|nr:hypothetical protein BN2476_650044 [Paraburkholderia piptadeniae]
MYLLRWSVFLLKKLSIQCGVEIPVGHPKQLVNRARLVQCQLSGGTGGIEKGADLGLTNDRAHHVSDEDVMRAGFHDLPNLAFKRCEGVGEDRQAGLAHLASRPSRTSPPARMDRRIDWPDRALPTAIQLP